MKITTAPRYTASINVGRQKGYSKSLWTKQDIIGELQEEQKTIIQEESIFLSASVSDCSIVLNGQNEPSVKIEFMNYPKFPLEENVLKKKVIALTEGLMKRLEQNRVVIIFHDELLMLEVDSDKIDQGIL